MLTVISLHLSSTFTIITLAFFAPHNQTPAQALTFRVIVASYIHMVIPCWTASSSVTWKALPKTRFRTAPRTLIRTFNHASPWDLTYFCHWRPIQRRWQSYVRHSSSIVQALHQGSCYGKGVKRMHRWNKRRGRTGVLRADRWIWCTAFLNGMQIRLGKWEWRDSVYERYHLRAKRGHLSLEHRGCDKVSISGGGKWQSVPSSVEEPLPPWFLRLRGGHHSKSKRKGNPRMR